MVKGAVPEFVIRRVWVDDLPTTTELKLKLEAESARVPCCVEERGATFAQPINSTEIPNAQAALRGPRIDSLLEFCGNNPDFPSLRLGNLKVPSREQRQQPVPGTVLGQDSPE